jgi:transcriptional regulator with XRE-family HTH domain
MVTNVIYDRESLKRDLKTKRVIDLGISMEVCSKQIGVSKPTLSRIENGSMPDLITFFKIIGWLGSDAKKYINY